MSATGVLIIGAGVVFAALIVISMITHILAQIAKNFRVLTGRTTHWTGRAYRHEPKRK